VTYRDVTDHQTEPDSTESDRTVQGEGTGERDSCAIEGELLDPEDPKPSTIEDRLNCDAFGNIFASGCPEPVAATPESGEPRNRRPEGWPVEPRPEPKRDPKPPKSKPDNSEAIHQLLELGECPGDIVRVLSGRGVTLADVLALTRG
jgi:hypothetical protein